MKTSTISTPAGRRLLVEDEGRASSYAVEDGETVLESISGHILQVQDDLARRQTQLERLQAVKAHLEAVEPLDLHKPGLYVVLDPKDVPVEESFATTGYSARANFLRVANKRWSQSVEEGYRIAEPSILRTSSK